MVVHHLHGDIYSSEELITELHTFFHINEKMVDPVHSIKEESLKAAKIPLKKVAKKQSLSKQNRDEDIDKPISNELIEELRQMREQQRKSSQQNYTGYAKSSK